MAAIGMQVGGEDAGRLARTQHHGAGAVAEQHAGAAVVPVEDAREGLRADHQRGRSDTALDETVGDRHAVDEAGTHRLDVERRSLGHAEFGLHARRRGGKRLVGRRRRQNDQVEVGRLDAGVVERPLRGLDREVGSEFAFSREVALANAGALPDPLVGGVHGLRKFFVGDDTLGQIRPTALDDRTNHAVPPVVCSDADGVSVAEVISCSRASPSTSLLLYS